MRDPSSSGTEDSGKLGEKGGRSTQSGHAHGLSTEDDTLDQSDYMDKD